MFEAKSRLQSQTPESKHHILIYSPVLSGLILFRLRAEMHDFGIAMENVCGAITYSAHLYNALTKENLLTRPWADMDVALSLLGDSNIWLGEDGHNRPSTPQGYFSRFCMQMGVSAAAFADPVRRRKKVNLRSRAGPRRIKEGLTAVSSVFANRYCNPGPGTVDWTPEHVANILAHSAYEKKTSPDGSTYTMQQIDDPAELREKRLKAKAKAKASPGSHKQERVEPAELVKALALSLNAEVLEMVFPYLVLHRQSWRLLRRVKEACNPLMRELYASSDLDQESNLTWVVGYIFLEASGGETGDGFKDMRLFKMAAAPVNSFLDPKIKSSKMALRLAREMGFEFQPGEESDSEGSGEDEEEQNVVD